jgi:small GTP-binding protein
MNYDLSFKISFIGDSRVGKSSLTHRLRHDICSSHVQTTIGVEYESCIINSINNKKTRLEIWDTAGQEVYRSITKHYYRSSSAIILVYDICSNKSFLNLESWMNEIKQNCCPDIPIYLIGNKLDKEINREVKKKRC